MRRITLHTPSVVWSKTTLNIGDADGAGQGWTHKLEIWAIFSYVLGTSDDSIYPLAQVCQHTDVSLLGVEAKMSFWTTIQVKYIISDKGKKFAIY